MSTSPSETTICGGELGLRGQNHNLNPVDEIVLSEPGVCPEHTSTHCKPADAEDVTGRHNGYGGQ